MRQIAPFRKRDKAIQQQFSSAAHIRSNTADGREIAAVWKARWIVNQEQMRAQASDAGNMAVAARIEWTRRLQRKERLARAESTVATFLRTEHVGLNDYLFQLRVPGYRKPDCD